MLTEEAHHMFVGESGVSRIIQRTCAVMNEKKTDDPSILRAAGVIDLPTLQRYVNFHYSVTVDLFGADVSSNAATFYSAGLKGRYEEAKRTDDHQLRDATYKLLDVRDGQLVERDVPMLNALNEVLRDDFIKDTISGVGRWNKVIEKAGLSFRLTVPHQAFNRKIGTFARTCVTPTGASSTRRPGSAGSASGCRRRRPSVRGLAHGPWTEPGKFAAWIAPPSIGINKQPVDFEYVRFTDSSRSWGLLLSGSLEVLKQHLIDPEVCIRSNTCEETCPVGAITHDSANYVVNAEICNACMACISPCPTGSIDNWRDVVKAAATASRTSSPGPSCPSKSPCQRKRSLRTRASLHPWTRCLSGRTSNRRRRASRSTVSVAHGWRPGQPRTRT